MEELTERYHAQKKNRYMMFRDCLHLIKSFDDIIKNVYICRCGTFHFINNHIPDGHYSYHICE